MADFQAIQTRVYREYTTEIGEAVEFLITEIRSELSAQGHNLSGSLSQSIRAKIFRKAGQVVAEVEMLKYGVYQDEGVRPSRIPFSRATGGRPGRPRSRFISALQAWVKERGMASGDKLALRIAFAIAAKMKKEGMPTRGAYNHTRNGRRTGFITRPWEDNRREVENKLATSAESYVDRLLGDVLLEIDQDFENLLLK